MKYPWQKFFSNSRGATSVEFALIATLLISLFAGVYAVGIYFVTWNRLQYGVEDAARYAAIHDDASTADLEGIVNDSLSVVSANPAALNIVVSNTSSNGIDFVEVDASYRFSWDLPFFSQELNNLSIQASSRMAVN